MRVIISSPIPEIAAEISVAATLAAIECETEPSLQEFCSRLFRDPDCIGLFWSAGPASASATIRQLRLAEVRNPLFAILDAEKGHAGDAADARAMVLNAGADDAQHWPVDSQEIVARLQAIHRREIEVIGQPIQMAGALFYPERSTVEGNGASVHLSKHECTVLETIARHPGLCITKAVIMLALYAQRDEAQIKIVDVFICKLRKKLAAATAGQEVIETVWGQGYRFVPAGFAPAVVDMRNWSLRRPA